MKNLRSIPEYLARCWRSCAHHAGHAVTALVVASVVGILHHAHYLVWLDSMMLQLVGSVHPKAFAQRGANVVPPEVLLLSRELYETAFDQRSPLDRTKVAELLSKLPLDEPRRPSTVVLDIDLSNNGQDPGQTVLDQALEAMVAHGINLVLPVPSPVRTLKAVQHKSHWINEACGWAARAKAGGKTPGSVTFASPELEVHGGLVLQYRESDLTLGVAAHRPKLVRKTGDEGGLDNDVCSRSAGEIETLVTLDAEDRARHLTTLGGHDSGLQPFNASYFGIVKTHLHVFNGLGPTAQSTIDGIDLSNRTVFVGGTYDDKDRFRTPLDPDGLPVEGVTLHAATYYSMIDPVSVEEGFLTLLADVVIGLAVGTLFSMGWDRHHEALRHRREHKDWHGYWYPKLTLLALLAVAAAIAVGLVAFAAHCLYPFNIWISPGPVVLGMFIKLVLTSRHEDLGHSQAPGDAPHHMPVSDIPKPAQWIDRAIIALVVGANAAMILSHHPFSRHDKAHLEHGAERDVQIHPGASR